MNHRERNNVWRCCSASSNIVYLSQLNFAILFVSKKLSPPPLQGWLIKLEDVPDQRFTIGWCFSFRHSLWPERTCLVPYCWKRCWKRGSWNSGGQSHEATPAVRLPALRGCFESRSQFQSFLFRFLSHREGNTGGGPSKFDEITGEMCS